MITKTIEIREVLTAAKNIFCYEPDGERIMLDYDNDLLVRNNPFGGLAYKTISDVERITFCYDLEAWEVTWKA